MPTCDLRFSDPCLDAALDGIVAEGRMLASRGGEHPSVVGRTPALVADLGVRWVWEERFLDS
jgi:hypothetical protein